MSVKIARRLAGALLLPALGFAAGCGDSGGGPAPAPAAQEAPPPEATPPAPSEPAPPSPPAPSEPPVADDPVARGAEQYQLYCASCHGATGDGDGPLSAGLEPKPAKHSDGGYMNALTDAHLRKVISEGGTSVGKSPLMAPWGGTLSEEQIGDVIVYIRSLAVPPYPAP